MAYKPDSVPRHQTSWMIIHLKSVLLQTL